MFSIRLWGTWCVAAQLATAVQLQQPRATPVNQLFPTNGWTPKPTSKPDSPLEFLRRQDDPSLCGYLNGDLDYPLYCDPGWNCMYDSVYSWFGCCTGTAITDCDVYTACVNSQSIDACLSSSECYDNTLVTGCAEDYAPFCATLYSVVDGNTYGHYGCADVKTSYEVMFSERDDGISTESDVASFTGFLSRETRVARTSDGEDSGTTAEGSTGTKSVSGGTRGVTTTEAPTFVQSGGGSATVSSGMAERTVIGAVGGVIGMLAALL